MLFTKIILMIIVIVFILYFIRHFNKMKFEDLSDEEVKTIWQFNKINK